MVSKFPVPLRLCTSNCVLSNPSIYDWASNPPLSDGRHCQGWALQHYDKLTAASPLDISTNSTPSTSAKKALFARWKARPKIAKVKSVMAWEHHTLSARTLIKPIGEYYCFVRVASKRNVAGELSRGSHSAKSIEDQFRGNLDQHKRWLGQKNPHCYYFINFFIIINL